MAKTIRDVARHAGVSIATVSRVLNKTARVKVDKRRKVEEAVKQLGFVPNQAARSLVNKKTKGIGILLPSLGGDFFSEFLQGIDEASRGSGHFVLISAAHGNLEELEKALKGMHKRVDGLIIMSLDNDEKTLKRLIPEGEQVVWINGEKSKFGFSTISFDHYHGAYMATEHLLDQGHRYIAMLKGPDLAYDSRQRLNGYRDALRARDIYPIPDLEIPGDFTQQGGYKAAEILLGLKPMPTAVYCANDQSAIGMMGAMQNAGVKIPDSLSIVGFDDIARAQFTAPPLSTVRTGIRQMGAMAIEQVIALVAGRPSTHIELPVELIVRQSTARLTSDT